MADLVLAGDGGEATVRIDGFEEDGALAITGKNYPLMLAAVSLDNVAGAMGNIASVALIMAGTVSARWGSGSSATSQ